MLRSEKEDFLRNEQNKQRFISVLGLKLERPGCTVFHAKQDADTLIVKSAIESAKTAETVLVGDDPDLLVMVIYHTGKNSKNVFLQPESKSNSTKCSVWDMKKTKELLGEDICQVILFIHAILGCYTSSRLHGHGKAAALKLVSKNSRFLNLARIFCDSSTTPKEDVIRAGESALVILYSGAHNDKLDDLRYKCYTEKMKKAVKAMEAKSLPPTSAAGRYHSLRVFYQICEGKGHASDLETTEWGWKVVGQKFQPITTDLPAAPPELLQFVRCMCKSGCNTLKCTCLKHELECTSACGECKGRS